MRSGRGRGGGGYRAIPGRGSAQAEPAKLLTLTQLRHVIRQRPWQLYDFDLRATVGTGTFGRVRMVRIKGREDKTPMALKIMKKAEVIRLKQVAHVLGEKDILSMIEHPFIVNLLATFHDEKRLFVLMEFINGGELFTYLRREGRLPNDHARFYTAEIVLALSYLHNLQIIYRDLKPENLLIDHEGHLKITDFGFAKVVDDKTFTLCGTPEYLAPEIIQSRGHGKAVDWWALGVLIYEMLAGYPPFFDDSPFGIYQKVLAGQVDYPRHFDLKSKDIVARLLALEKSKRLGSAKQGSEDIKKHKWYRGMDWDLLLNRSVPPPFYPDVKSPEDTSMFDRYPESTEARAPAVASKDQTYFSTFAYNG